MSAEVQTTLDTVNEQIACLADRLRELLVRKGQLLSYSRAEYMRAAAEIQGQFEGFGTAQSFLSDVEMDLYVLDQIECARQDEEEERQQQN